MARGDKIQFGRAKSAWLIATNPVLNESEPVKEQDTGRFKLGDGRSPYNDLPYYLPEPEIQAAIQAAIDALPPSSGGGGGEVTLEMLTAHINSLTPHPVYDDGDSFVGLYRNAKV
jgi:hyaluronoglucosaminidase